MDWGQIAAALIVPVSGAIGWIWKRNIEIAEKHRQCELRQHFLESQMAVLASENERRDRESESTVVVDSGGFIREWSPASTLLFHWQHREVIGKHVTVLMPERFHDQFHEAWGRLVESKRPPRRGPHHQIGKTKSGHEVPLTMYYSGWEKDDGERMLGARIRFRPGASDYAEDCPVED